MTTANNETGLIAHLFRQEYSKMTAVLCRHFGLKHIEIAEDIVSDTFLKVSEHWGINGIPDNPTAWLYTAAKNKAKDYIKRTEVFENKVRGEVKPDEEVPEPDLEFSHQNIKDSQLAMIFAVCMPGNSVESQICLALQILCGFSVEEIANAFLTGNETIKKRLQRGRTQLREAHFQIRHLSEAEIRSRQDTVLKTLYLLFNEGYFSKTNSLLIRKDLCSEAIRLALVLTENKLTDTPQTNALLALMCFQSSRLEARLDEEGRVILFEQQNEELWDKGLIDRGNCFLVAACNGSELSKYHLEAAIAYWHARPSTIPDKWTHILFFYNQLLQLEYSPVIALNRTFAFAKVYGCEQGIAEAEKLNLEDSCYYHSLLGYLYAGVCGDKAVAHYSKAIELTKSVAEKLTLQREIERIPDGTNRPPVNR